jgi:secreted trypsin-like serine protease
VHRPIARLGGLLLAATVVATLGAAPATAVSGGAPAEPGAYPFLARIAVGDDRSCTGSLVEAQWLLTAADCFADAGIDRADPAGGRAPPVRRP